jgi:hypothetical protein
MVTALSAVFRTGITRIRRDATYAAEAQQHAFASQRASIFTWTGDVIAQKQDVGGVLVCCEHRQDRLDLILAHQHDDQIVGIVWRELFHDSDARRRAFSGQGVFQHDAVLAQIGQALSTREDRGIVSGCLQPRRKETAERACSVD